MKERTYSPELNNLVIAMQRYTESVLNLETGALRSYTIMPHSLPLVEVRAETLSLSKIQLSMELGDYKDER